MLLALKALYWSKVSQESKSELCSNVGHDRCIWLPAFFSQFLLTLVHSGAIPPHAVNTRGLNKDFSMSVTLWLYLPFLFFMLLVDL